jgi:fatty acid desaturase
MAPRTRSTRTAQTDDVRPLVPRVLRLTAALGWRILVVLAAIYVVGVIAGRLAAVVVPVAVAVLLAALLSPAVQALHRHGIPTSAATAPTAHATRCGESPKARKRSSCAGS